MAKHTIIAQVKGEALTDDNCIANLLKGVKDGRYLIELSTAKKRTNPQNRYYHGLVVPMIKKGMEDAGNEVSSQEVHEFLKARFNYVEIVNHDTGEMYQLPKSTASLTTVQFSEFIARVQRFAAEFLGVVIPDPGQQCEMAF